MTATELQAAFAGFTCDKMLRAWRNRSPVTHDKWHARAALLRENGSHLAAALYVACGELCNADGTFDAGEWPPAHWQYVAARLPDLLHNAPDKALSRGEYCERRKSFGST